ncbi:MAG: hypothetical protein PIR02_08785 [Microbacterium enclense]
MSGDTFQVTSRASTARQDGAVIVTPPDGAPVALTAAQARELQRAILSAVVTIERDVRAVVAKTKAAEARKLRRAADVDETLRERDR